MGQADFFPVNFHFSYTMQSCIPRLPVICTVHNQSKWLTPSWSRTYFRYWIPRIPMQFSYRDCIGLNNLPHILQPGLLMKIILSTSECTHATSTINRSINQYKMAELTLIRRLCWCTVLLSVLIHQASSWSSELENKHIIIHIDIRHITKCQQLKGKETVTVKSQQHWWDLHMLSKDP